jgi:hypothetical protein
MIPHTKGFRCNVSQSLMRDVRDVSTLDAMSQALRKLSYQEYGHTILSNIFLSNEREIVCCCNIETHCSPMTR